MSRILILALIFAVILLGMVFHLRNDQLVILDYLVGSSKFYFSVWLVCAFTIGALSGLISSTPLILRIKRENARLLKRVRNSEKELNNLRVLPVKDTH